MSLETTRFTNEHLMESHLIASVQEYLNLHLTKNAIFLAERLVAQFPSETNLHLLATCYHRSGQTYRAYHLLRGWLQICSAECAERHRKQEVLNSGICYYRSD